MFRNVSFMFLRGPEITFFVNMAGQTHSVLPLGNGGPRARFAVDYSSLN